MVALTTVLIGLAGLLASGSVAAAETPVNAAASTPPVPAGSSATGIVLWVGSALVAVVIGLLVARRDPARVAA